MQNLSVNDLHKREEISGMKLSLHEKKIYYVYDGSDHTHKRLGTDRQCEPGAKISKAHDLLPLTWRSPEEVSQLQEGLLYLSQASQWNWPMHARSSGDAQLYVCLFVSLYVSLT